MPLHPASALRAAALASVLAVLLLAHLHIGKLLSPALGRYPGTSDPSWRINASQTLQLARNWYRFGLAKNGFLPHFMRPRAEEPYPTSPYVSYPPMFVILPWLSAKVNGKPPELEHIAAWGRLFHFLSAALLALLAWGLCIKNSAGTLASAVAATAAGMLALYSPIAAAYFPFAWWADAAGLPFFLGLVVLEVLLPATTPARRALHALVVAAGIFADWLFFLLLAAMIARSLSARPRRLRPELLLLPLAYAALHLLLVWKAGLFDHLWAKVAFRSGLERQEVGLLAGLGNWWGGFKSEAGAPIAWAATAALLLTPFLAAFFFRRLRTRRPEAWLEASYLLCVPVLLHFALLRQHYYEHPYENLKLVLLASAFWLGVMPAIVFGCLHTTASKLFFAACLAAIAGAATWSQPSNLRDFVGRRIDLPASSEEFCKAVFRASEYPDIHFSPDFATTSPLSEGKQDPRVESWAYVACNAHVYLARRPSEIFDLYAKLGWHARLAGGPYRLLLWTGSKPGPAWTKALVPGTEREFGGIRVQELSRSVLQ